MLNSAYQLFQGFVCSLRESQNVLQGEKIQIKEHGWRGNIFISGCIMLICSTINALMKEKTHFMGQMSRFMHLTAHQKQIYKKGTQNFEYFGEVMY